MNAAEFQATKVPDIFLCYVTDYASPTLDGILICSYHCELVVDESKSCASKHS